MLTAITRKPSPALARCALEYLTRQPIDVERAQLQHQVYEACLTDLGVRVLSLPAQSDLPDAAFVEDPAVILDEVAIVTILGAEERRKESDSLAAAISPFRPILRLHEPATLDGGDLLRAGRTLFAGLSTRTNHAAIAQLASMLDPYGYSVTPVEVRGCLHLKTACSYLEHQTILANRQWIDIAPFRNFHIIDVPSNEPWSANVMRIDDTILAPSFHPAAAGILERSGYRVMTVDISEFMKAEAGLTCLSLLFESSTRPTQPEPRSV